jgi:hypothetical protein
MRRTQAPALIGSVGIAGGVMILVGFPIGKVEPATPSIKVPGPYPYETPVQVPAPPPVPESSPFPSPAPFPYRDSLAPAPVRDSRIENARRPLTAKAVREAAFKYNGVANFLWISGSTSCRCQRIRSKTRNNTRTCKGRPCRAEKRSVAP